MKSSKLFTTLATTFFLIAILVMAIYFIKSSSKDYETKTVEWFEKHPTERRDIFVKCTEDARELGENPNCINVRHAIENISSQNSSNANKYEQ